MSLNAWNEDWDAYTHENKVYFLLMASDAGIDFLLNIRFNEAYWINDTHFQIELEYKGVSYEYDGNNLSVPNKINNSDRNFIFKCFREFGILKKMEEIEK